MSRAEREQTIQKLTAQMRQAAQLLEFEHAAYLREKIEKIKKVWLSSGQSFPKNDFCDRMIWRAVLLF